MSVAGLRPEQLNTLIEGVGSGAQAEQSAEDRRTDLFINWLRIQSELPGTPENERKRAADLADAMTLAKLKDSLKGSGEGGLSTATPSYAKRVTEILMGEGVNPDFITGLMSLPPKDLAKVLPAFHSAYTQFRKAGDDPDTAYSRALDAANRSDTFGATAGGPSGNRVAEQTARESLRSALLSRIDSIGTEYGPEAKNNLKAWANSALSTGAGSGEIWQGLEQEIARETAKLEERRRLEKEESDALRKEFGTKTR